METHPGLHSQTAPNGKQDVPLVEAQVFLTSVSHSPEIILSFDGSNAPTALFVELNRVGWSIPAVPPPPSSAIDWTPDPATGADYTLLPWRVTDFRIDSGSWTEKSAPKVGGLTMAALKRNRVMITNLRSAAAA